MGITRNTRQMLLWAFALPGILLSCGKEGNSAIRGEESQVPVELALSLGFSSPETRSDPSVITEISDVPAFRGMDSIRMIPFETGGVISGDDPARSHPESLPSIGKSLDSYAVSDNVYHSGLIKNNNSHLYPSSYASLPAGCRSVLIYGKATVPQAGEDEIIETKQNHGSLVESGFDGSSWPLRASDLHFSPETVPAGGTQEATTLVSILNSIVFGYDDLEEKGIEYYYDGPDGRKYQEALLNWDAGIGDDNLRDYFVRYTNSGELLSGAGDMVETELKELYLRLLDYESYNSTQYEVTVAGVEYPARSSSDNLPLLYSELYRNLAARLLARIEHNTYLETSASSRTLAFKDGALREYPRSYGLPDGCAAVRWTPAGFVIPAENGIEGLMPKSAVCFPPALYYFANTTLLTEAGEYVHNYYNASVEKWDEILSHYRNGSVVTTNTKSVALEQPMRYAVALVCTTVRATAQRLPDGDGDPSTNVEVSGNNFPVTGIIIGGQRTQNFDFTPDPSAQVRYLWDSRISGVYLGTETSSTMRTMALQTLPEEDVFFCMEFLNNSGKSFHGAEGLVLPGHPFYLTGKLELPEDPELDSVFIQDHATTVSCSVSSFENALNTVPDLGKVQLVLGVRTSVNWVQSSPTTVILD